MSRLLSLLMCLSFTLPSFASESFSEIAAQKQFQKNVDSYQRKLSKVEANDAFKADMIEKALSNKEATIAALEKSSVENKEVLIAKIEKDTDGKVALMQEFDPQTLKDMAIMDVQAVQTSGVYIFYITQGLGEAYYKCNNEISGWARTEGCHKAFWGTIFYPVILALDLITLPATFAASIVTGF